MKRSGECIGAGESARVYALDSHLAVKRFKRDKAFRKEMEAYKRLNQVRHVQMVFGVAHKALVMERHSCSMEDILSIPELEEIYGYLRPTWVEQLEEFCVDMTARGFSHGDLKAKNILLGGDDLECIYVCDFGYFKMGHEHTKGIEQKLLRQIESWCSEKDNINK